MKRQFSLFVLRERKIAIFFHIVTLYYTNEVALENKSKK